MENRGYLYQGRKKKKQKSEKVKSKKQKAKKLHINNGILSLDKGGPKENKKREN